MLATALQLVLVMAALHLMALRHRLMSIFDPVDMINMPHLTHAYSNHYVLPPFFLFSVFESLICHVQNLDDGSSPVSNHDGAWNFGVCNTSPASNFDTIYTSYTHHHTREGSSVVFDRHVFCFQPTDICFPLSRDKTAASTQRATMMALATYRPVAPPCFEFLYDRHILHPSSYPWRF